MNNKWYIPVLIILLGVVILGIAYIQSLNVAPTAQVPEDWKFTLPAGDAAAGRIAFTRLQCNVCHKSRLTPVDRIPQNTRWAGPDLTTGYEKLPAAYLAESIIKAHDKVADPFYTVTDSAEGMGKYNRHLTVQELIDLVAFLKQPQELTMK